MARRRNKSQERHIAKGRIDRLLRNAEREALGPDPDLADRHAALAKRVAMRYQIPCRPLCRCGVFPVPGRNTRVRIHAGRVITTCTCGHIRRRPIP